MADYYVREVEEHMFRAVTAKLFTDGVPPAARVLDVGAGTGRLSFAYAEKGCEVLAIDVSRAMLSHIDTRKGSLRIKTLEASAFNLPLPNASFDVVASMDLDIHFPNWEEILFEKARVCRTGGYVILSALSKENSSLLNDSKYVSHGVTDFFTRDYAAFVSDAELNDAAHKCGLEVECVTPYNFFVLNSMLGYSLTTDEARTFSDLYSRALANPQFLDIIARFEERIVRNLPSSSTVSKVVKMRKL